MIKKAKSVLIIEDQMINRKILKGILDADYTVLEAANGEEGLSVLEANGEEIIAILLDIVMPKMNGYEFLDELKNTKYKDMPVIAMTGETDNNSELIALEKGAWDFVPKPYQPQVLRSRLKNAIARSKMFLLDQMQYMAEHDMLTGLYNRQMLFSETRRMLDKYKDTGFALIRLDIDRFRLLNSFWGEKECDNFLKYIANILTETVADIDTCTYGRVEADVFCVCEPYNKQKIELQISEIKKKIEAYKEDYFIEPSFGIYVIDQQELPVEQMYTRTHMAANHCKNQYMNYICYYEEFMEKEMLRDQSIVNEMQHALDNEEFVVYLQPKMNIITEKPSGSEALVRWIHPEKGLISPGVFIPVFEANGFVGKLDYYMWEKVCQLINRWEKEGREVLPISVNLSRVNLYNPNIVEMLCGLVEKYNIPMDKFQLELTESACMDNPEMMKTIIQRLQDKGFILLMDDFGSGYSSLNTLKDIKVDVLKIDLKFLADDDNNDRSQIILKNVVTLAKQLAMPAIVEGVETKAQVDFLKSIGCEYVQGFYYARPMPVVDYEKFVDERK